MAAKASSQLDFPPIALDELVAVRQLIAGQADAAQQKKALDWLMREVFRFSGISFEPGNPEMTAFMEGRRYCGHLLKQAMLPAIWDKAKADSRKLQAAQERAATQEAK